MVPIALIVLVLRLMLPDQIPVVEMAVPAIIDAAEFEAAQTETGGYRRDHLRALTQCVEVDAKEIRIRGSKFCTEAAP